MVGTGGDAWTSESYLKGEVAADQRLKGVWTECRGAEGNPQA